MGNTNTLEARNLQGNSLVVTNLPNLKINQLIYMDDIKLFAENEKELEKQ